jgi:hypothetical protein
MSTLGCIVTAILFGGFIGVFVANGSFGAAVIFLVIAILLSSLIRTDEMGG